MKKVFFLAIMAGMVFFGCSQDNSDFNPVGPSTELNTTSDVASSFVSLPTNDEISLSKIISSRTEWISPYKSETIYISRGYWSHGSYIRIKMSLHFDRGAVDNYVKASAEMDTDEAAFNFYPSPLTFNNPVTLNFEISGLMGDDLERFKQVKKFVFIDENGAMEEMSFDKLGVEENQFWGIKYGTFILENCKIPHFSRFGFVN